MTFSKTIYPDRIIILLEMKGLSNIDHCLVNSESEKFQLVGAKIKNTDFVFKIDHIKYDVSKTRFITKNSSMIKIEIPLKGKNLYELDRDIQAKDNTGNAA